MIKLISSANLSYPHYTDVERILGKGFEGDLKVDGLNNMRYKEWHGESLYGNAKFEWVTQEPYNSDNVDGFFQILEYRIYKLFKEYQDLKSLTVTLYFRDNRDTESEWDIRKYYRSDYEAMRESYEGVLYD